MINLPFFKYIKKFPLTFSLESAGGILYNSLAAYVVVLMGRVIDASVAGDFGEIIKAVIIYLLMVLLCQFGRYIKRYYVSKFSMEMEMDLKKDVFNSILGKSLPDLDRDKVGDLISRTTIDVTRTVAAISKTLEEIWDTYWLLGSYLISLLIMNWKITLLSSVFIPFSILAAELIRHPLNKYSKRYSVTSGKISTQLQQMITGINVLRLFGAESQKKTALDKQCEKQVGASLGMAIFESGMAPVYVAVASIGVFVIISLGGKQVLSGEWKIGEFWSFLTIFTAMAARTTVAAKVFNTWHVADAAWDRIKEQLNSKESFCNEDIEPFKMADLQIKNMSYRYPLGDSDAITNIGFSLKSNQIYGITGPVGCGKTALCLSVTGKYPYSGSIMINSHELRDMNENERAGYIAYLGHEQFLFSASVRDNITMNVSGTMIIDDELLSEAVDVSCLNEDLQQMENGIETIIGERGAKVSGGQKQRIALARVIYTQKPLLLLDDPFSALDILTEKKIIDNLKRLKDKTVIILSHRLAAFENADCILVLQNGQIVEQGSHTELMGNNSIYSEIYSAQGITGGEAI